MSREDAKVNARVETVEDALLYVVRDARQRLTDLQWQRFDVDPKLAGETFDITCGVILNAATKLGLPLNLVNQQRLQEAALLDTLPPHQKRVMGDGVHWLVLTETMGPETATRVRDYLWVKGIDVVAGRFNLDMEELTLSFSIGHFDQLIPLFQRLSQWLPDFNHGSAGTGIMSE